MVQDKWIVIFGNVVDGLYFHGTFKSLEDAVQYAYDNRDNNEDWTVAELELE